MAAAGLAIALHDTDHYDLSDDELIEAGQGLGFSVVPEDTARIREIISLAETASRLRVASDNEPFEPYTVSFSRSPNGEIEAMVSICGVTLPPHVLLGIDIQFAWDYQRAARECLEASKEGE